VQVAGGVDEHGPHITIAFSLPAGSYATVLLREIMKAPDQAPGEPGERGEHPEEAAAPAGSAEK
jgi:tRNA(Glu) U13 pseudouridine synthase TruD